MKRVAIIGAGLAGTACAYVLKRHGMEPVIYEAGGEIAPGASGNRLGLYNPRLSALKTTESDFYAAAYGLFLQTMRSSALAEDDKAGWNQCGSLHLMTDEAREKRFRQCVENWGWPEEEMHIVSAKEASGIAGAEMKHGALWLPGAGVVSPEKLCRAYAEDVEIHLNTRITHIEDVKADAVIIANGMGAKDFVDLPLKAVRGQVTDVKATEASGKLQCNLCYGGYLSPAMEGVHMLGSTFQRWLGHSDLIPEDNKDNLEKLYEAVPAMTGFAVAGARAAVRTTAPDHFPFIGKVREGVYVSTAHGSHGIISSLAGAHLIADMIREGPLCLRQDVVERLAIR